MPQVNIIASNDLWSRIKAKFGFPHQSASQILFENRCILVQDIATFMSDPEIGTASLTPGAGIHYFAQVPIGHRWHLSIVTFFAALAEVDALYIKDINATQMAINSFADTKEVTIEFNHPIILNAGWEIGFLWRVDGSSSIGYYFVDEVVA